MNTAARRGRNGLGLVTAIGLAGAVVVALAAVPRVTMGYVRAPAGSVDQLSLPIAQAGVLQILNTGGHIAVSAWDGDRVLLTITREAVRGGNPIARWLGGKMAQADGGTAPRVRENEAGVEVSMHHKDSAAVNYRIDVKLPRGRGLDASTGNGPITVHGIDGDVRAMSDNGDVHCEGVSGRVKATVQNGNVFCRFVSGAIDINAANGSVEIEHGRNADANAVRVWTTNGAIRFSATIPAVSLLAETQNGRVLAQAAPGVDVRQTLRMLDSRGEGEAAEVELHAINGNIYVDAF